MSPRKQFANPLESLWPSPFADYGQFTAVRAFKELSSVAPVSLCARGEASTFL